MLSFSSRTEQRLLQSSHDRATAARSASLIVPRLYLSNYLVASDETQLSALGITHVVSVLERKPQYKSQGLRTLHISITDTPNADLLQHLDTTTDFIKTALAENAENNVLVHCLMGISRSATVVCAYLVATTSMTAPDALQLVMTKRSIVCPNIGFRQQLETYAMRSYGKGAKVKSIADIPKERLVQVGESLAQRIKKLKARGVASSGSEQRAKTVTPVSATS